MLVVATPSTGAPSAALESVSAQLHSLADVVSSLTTPVFSASPTGNATSCGSHFSPVLASTMTRDEIVLLLHHDNSSLPSVHPCNTANALDTKTHWLAQELHHIMGCCKFWNYKTILQVSLDGECVDHGDFHLPWVCLPLSPKQSAVSLLIRKNIGILMRFTWILPLATAFQLAISIMP
jgi:hypothetical protein